MQPAVDLVVLHYWYLLLKNPRECLCTVQTHVIQLYNATCFVLLTSTIGYELLENSESDSLG